MKRVFHSEDDIPFMLDANCVASILSISKSSAYGLMHAKDFPTICVGKRLLVKKSSFLEWLNKDAS